MPLVYDQLLLKKMYKRHNRVNYFAVQNSHCIII